MVEVAIPVGVATSFEHFEDLDTPSILAPIRQLRTYGTMGAKGLR